MTCPQCVGLEKEFGEDFARRELRRYRRRGVGAPTRLLVAAILEAGGGETLLDIGGGVGGIQHALLEDGARSAVAVDASSALLDAARQEALRRHLNDRIRFLHGDFLELADTLSPADVVTLDKVICCYPAMEALVAESADRARRLWGTVYPRRTLLNRLMLPVINLVQRLRRIPMRTFLHPPEEIRRVVRQRGLVPRWRSRTLVWEVEVWEREADVHA